jgi:ubiquitin-conjugating enzyme E2 variant
MILFHVLAAWLLADFITGVFHFVEDRYMGENTTLELFQSMAQGNLHHHRYPTAITLVGWWDNMRSAAYFAWPLGLVLWLLGVPVWLWLGVTFTSVANLVHRWAHEPRAKLGKAIRFMQWTGLFIPRQHHDRHHYADGIRVDPKHLSRRAYCPMTCWVNPVLDLLGFWRGVEWVLAAIGVQPQGPQL